MKSFELRNLDKKVSKMFQHQPKKDSPTRRTKTKPPVSKTTGNKICIGSITESICPITSAQWIMMVSEGLSLKWYIDWYRMVQVIP